MSRQRYKPEQIINHLRQVEVLISQGQTIGQVSHALGISEQSYDRWRAEYGGMKLEQVKRLKEREKENARLRQAVANLTFPTTEPSSPPMRYAPG